MKISTKSIVIASSIVALGGAGLIYYLLNQNSTQASSWMNSNWLYRRSIAVANSGSTLVNEDVLVEVDTATLVSAGKLQSDCDDLRFVDSNDSSSLTYWVEGGCNTAYTQVWVQIPSLTSGGKTIYMYYGNSSAANSEQTWTGNFTLLADATCPTGWTRNSDMDSRIPYGDATTYGTTGGSATHNHGGTLSGTTGGPSATASPGGSSQDLYYALSGHTHTVSASVSSETLLPPYKQTIFCKRDELTAITSLIAIQTSSTPSGWTRVSGLDTYFPYGSTTYGTTGGSSTHTHILLEVFLLAPQVQDLKENLKVEILQYHKITHIVHLSQAIQLFPICPNTKTSCMSKHQVQVLA